MCYLLASKRPLLPLIISTSPAQRLLYYVCSHKLSIIVVFMGAVLIRRMEEVLGHISHSEQQYLYTRINTNTLTTGSCMI